MLSCSPLTPHAGQALLQQPLSSDLPSKTVHPSSAGAHMNTPRSDFAQLP